MSPIKMSRLEYKPDKVDSFLVQILDNYKTESSNSDNLIKAVLWIQKFGWNYFKYIFPRLICS